MRGGGGGVVFGEFVGEEFWGVGAQLVGEFLDGFDYVDVAGERGQEVEGDAAYAGACVGDAQSGEGMVSRCGELREGLRWVVLPRI